MSEINYCTTDQTGFSLFLQISCRNLVELGYSIPVLLVFVALDYYIRISLACEFRLVAVY